jgi:hypothetical protein
VVGLLGSSGAPGLPAAYERKPSGRGRRRRADAPDPQAGGTGRNVPAAPRQHEWPGRPPRAGQSLTAKDHHQGRASGTSPLRGADP